MDAAYPRPQLQRDDWLSLNGPWRFRFDDPCALRHPADIDQWPLEIRVPYPPESQASGIGDRGFHRACWYQRDFTLAPGPDRVILRFGAVDYGARVWVNGALVATHEGGHTPFAADITHQLDPSGRQCVTLRAEDDPHDLTQPRGKQDWQLEPHALWYPRTTGIWQTVWIERVPRTYVDRIRWTPRVEGFALGFEARVKGDPAPDLAMEVTLRHGERIAGEAHDVVGGRCERPLIDGVAADITCCCGCRTK